MRPRQDLSVYNSLKDWWRKRPTDAGVLGGGGGEPNKAPPLPLVLGFGATSAVCGAVVRCLRQKNCGEK